MTTATERHDWDADVATRTQTLGGGEITAILALAGATDVRVGASAGAGVAALIVNVTGALTPAAFPTVTFRSPKTFGSSVSVAVIDVELCTFRLLT